MTPLDGQGQEFDNDYVDDTGTLEPGDTLEFEVLLGDNEAMANYEIEVLEESPFV